MKPLKIFALALLLPFLGLTFYAIYQVGYIGIFDYHRHSPAGWQVFADLVVALLLVLCWLIPDARKNGLNPIPWVVATLFLGSIGPLLYLAFAKRDAQESIA